MPDPNFRTVFASVRPQRVVTFIDRNDADWRNTCLRVIEVYSRVWGGNYNIIVPTDGTTILPIFWSIVELYDPDYLYYYLKTGTDLKTSKNDEFEALVDRQTQAWVQRHVPAEDWTTRRADFDQNISRAPFSDFHVSAALQAELKARLAPFFFQNYIVQAGALTARSDPRYPLTALKDILPHCQHPPHVLIPNVQDGAVPALWPASALGLTSPAFETEVQAAGVFFNNVAVDTDNAEALIAQVVAGHGLLGEDTIHIADLAGTQLNRYRRYRPGEQDAEAPIVLVAGDTVDDFCLYHCLSRMRGRVFWVQPAWLDTFHAAKARAEAGGAAIGATELHGHYLADHIYHLAEEGEPRNIPLLSHSLSTDQLVEIASKLDGATFRPGVLAPRLAPTTDLRDALQEPYRAYEIENTGRDITKHVVDGEIIGLFETPRPRRFDTIVPEHRWIAELVIDEYQVPRHPELGTFFVRDHRLMTNGARAGLVALGYACPNIGYIQGADLDSILIRPKVHLPAVLNVFQHLADTVGLRCALSVKGVYELEAVEKFAGLANLATTLRDPTGSAILKKFIDNTAATPGVHDDGVFLRPDGQRYLDVPAIAKIVGSSNAAIELIDKYIAAGIVYRGLILKCTFCRSTDWFQLADIDQSFHCKRCNRRQVIASANQVRPGEPQFFYKLDQLILRGLQNDMDAPVLTLDWIRRYKRDSFLAAADMEFFEPGANEPFMESDICCFCDHDIVIGEAKTTNRLGKTGAQERANIQAYLTLAERLGVRRVVFSTTSSEWSATTVGQVNAVFATKAIHVDLLRWADLVA